MVRPSWEFFLPQIMAVLQGMFPQEAKLGHFVDHGLEQLREACSRGQLIFAANWRCNELEAMWLLLTSVRMSAGMPGLSFMDPTTDPIAVAPSKNVLPVLDLLQAFFCAERMATIQSFYVDLKGAMATLELLIPKLANQPELKHFFESVRGILIDTYCCTRLLIATED